MGSVTQRNLIQRLARHFGIRLGHCARVDERAWSYDGQVLDIRARYQGYMGKRPDSDSMHDIAHHLCASPDRHHLPEWGLGTGVDWRSREAECVVDDPGKEESMASLLGIFMERAAGWDWRETYRKHNWDDHGLTDLVALRRELGTWLIRNDRSLEEILGVVEEKSV